MNLPVTSGEQFGARENGHFPGPGDLVDPKKYVLEITPGTSDTWYCGFLGVLKGWLKQQIHHMIFSWHVLFWITCIYCMFINIYIIYNTINAHIYSNTIRSHTLCYWLKMCFFSFWCVKNPMSPRARKEKAWNLRISQELLEGKKAPWTTFPPLSGEDQNPVKLTLADLQDYREDMHW